MCGEVRFLTCFCISIVVHGYVIPSALRPHRRRTAGREDALLSGKLQYPQARFISDFIRFPTNRPFYSDEEHDLHSCDLRLCPATCELCKRLCAQPHLHGLDPGAHHLCGSVCFTRFLLPMSSFVSRTHRESHSCSEQCAASGICQIDTAPQSVEATFTGRHETFQYTKVSTE